MRKNKEFDYKTDSISINSNPIRPEAVNYINNFSNSASHPIINKYLKAMSKYNIINKGISNYYSNIIGFNFNISSFGPTNKLIKNIYKLLVYSFKSMYCLISKPVFVITPNKIIIQLFYYLFIPNILKSKKIYKFGNKRRNNLRIYLKWKKRRNNIKKLYRKFRKFNINNRIKLRRLYLFNITTVYPEKFKKLCEILSNLFKKPVELDLIRLHYPYSDSNILANFLAIMINRIKLRIIVKRLFGKAVLKNKKFSSTASTNKLNIIPAFLSGINIKVAGRLLNNKIIPRKTVKTIRRGAVAKGKINYLDVARYTNKNKRGAYSITVSSGQNYF
uniref:Small ribosomal subunit protein uS3m n=1 Tax=Amanita inopinata TaxID=933333 RepID=A0A5Q0N2A0_9AGAR|nr:ribosomal protein S3 [Amanita inopinata]QFZ98593.1 ribosomal protein S3 [Amanita inopinata]